MIIVITLAVILPLVLAVMKLVCGVKLMNDYHIDEYLATPRARRLWIGGMAAPLLIVALATIESYATHLWWVELAAWFLCVTVTYRIVWAVRMRLTGRYREFYKAAQWQ